MCRWLKNKRKAKWMTTGLTPGGNSIHGIIVVNAQNITFKCFNSYRSMPKLPTKHSVREFFPENG